MTFAKINDNTFILNNILFTKNDLILLLELCGYEIPGGLDSSEFTERAEYTLSTLIGDPIFNEVFEAWRDFSEPDKALWRQLVTDRSRARTLPSRN